MAEETTKTAGSLIKAVGRVSQARSKFFDRGAAIVDPAINKMKKLKPRVKLIIKLFNKEPTA